MKFNSLKEVIVALAVAHKNGDQEAMRKLSQTREYFKRKERRALKECRCGTRIRKDQDLCVACQHYGPLRLPKPKINYRTGKPSKYVRFKDTGLIFLTVQKTNGNFSEAGRLLGISHKTVAKHFKSVSTDLKGMAYTLTVTPEMCQEALDKHKTWKAAMESLGLNAASFHRKLSAARQPTTRMKMRQVPDLLCVAALAQHGSYKAAAAAMNMGYATFGNKLRRARQQAAALDSTKKAA